MTSTTPQVKFEGDRGLLFSNEAYTRLPIALDYRSGGAGRGIGEGSQVDDTLAEFYRKREDERLGRWRDTEHTHIVVYPYDPAGKFVRLVNETTGTANVVARANPGLQYKPEIREAAKRYFDAHPYPKPWDDAQDGDIWDFDGLPAAYQIDTWYWVLGGDEVDFRDVSVGRFVYRTGAME